MAKNKSVQIVSIPSPLGGEGLRHNGTVRRVFFKEEADDAVFIDLEDLVTAEIFPIPFAKDFDTGTPLREIIHKLAPEVTDDKLIGEIDLNAILKGKPCQFIVARKAGAGGKFRLEVVLVLPPNSLTFTKAA
jgi:hypothetical protein